MGRAEPGLEAGHYIDNQAATRVVDHEGAIQNAALAAGRNRREPLLHCHWNRLDLFLPARRQTATAPELLSQPRRQCMASIVIGHYGRFLAGDAVARDIDGDAHVGAAVPVVVGLTFVAGLVSPRSG